MIQYTLQRYQTVFKRFPRLLSYGLLHSVASSFGQTFFIALFYPSFISELNLDKTMLGSIYGAATLLSGFVIPFLTPYLDRASARQLSIVNILVLVLSILLLGQSNSWWLLLFGFFGVRLTGQGFMLAIANVVTSKHTTTSRGSSLSFVALGHPLGEAIFPILYIFLISHFTWRYAWNFSIVLLLLFFLPVFLLLTRTSLESEAHLTKSHNSLPVQTKQWTRKEILRHKGFWALLPFWAVPGFLLTGYFFHTRHFEEERLWSAQWLATCFIAFAVARIFASLLSGPLCDRFGAAKVILPSIAPMFIGFLFLVGSYHPIFCLLYFIFQGIGMGLSGTARSTYLAEAFGVEHLGSINGVLMSTGIIATAISPPLFGFLLEHGISFHHISVFSPLPIVLGVVLAAWGMRTLKAP
jgi:MFS family permease